MLSRYQPRGDKGTQDYSSSSNHGSSGEVGTHRYLGVVLVYLVHIFQTFAFDFCGWILKNIVISNEITSYLYRK